MNPTGHQLEQTVKEFVAKRGFQTLARLLVYYAGHGHTERRGGRSHGYLVPVDAPLPADDIIGFRTHAVDLNDFVTRANHAESKHVLVAFDSCFSGRVFESRALPSAYVLQMVRDPVRLFLTAGSVHEPVPDQSEFRRAFVSGLGGAADLDGDGFVLGNELFSYVRKRVINAGAINQQAQTPQWRAMPAGVGPVGDVVFVVPQPENDSTAGSNDILDVADAGEQASFAQQFAAIDAVMQQEQQARELVQAAQERARHAEPAMQARIWQVALDQLPNIEGSSIDDQLRVKILQHLSQATAERDRPAWATASGTDDFGQWATLRLGTVEQRLRWIGPGQFIMGSFPTDPERNPDEVPHRVTLTQGFWLADTEVTQALWQEVMQGNPSRFLGDMQRPVEQVHWHDCQAFLQQLQQRLLADHPRAAGLQLRLPTEAEWEYAARAGTSTMTYGGDFRYVPQGSGAVAGSDLAALEKIAWFGVNSGVQWSGTNGVQTEAHPDGVGTWQVGQRQPNAWGLYDMLGNVWEWCADYYGPYPATAVVDPVGPTSGAQRVVRGGSFFCRALELSVRASWAIS